MEENLKEEEGVEIDILSFVVGFVIAAIIIAAVYALTSIIFANAEYVELKSKEQTSQALDQIKAKFMAKLDEDYPLPDTSEEEEGLLTAEKAREGYVEITDREIVKQIKISVFNNINYAMKTQKDATILERFEDPAILQEITDYFEGLGYTVVTTESSIDFLYYLEVSWN